MTNSAFPLPNPGGTVSSVALTITPAAAGSVAGSPITNSGTLALTLHGNLLNIQRFLTGAAATYTPTPGTNTARIRMIGGGGGGGSATSTGGTQISVGGGGGAGGYIEHLLTGVSGTYTYTVGTGGASGASGNPSLFSGGTLIASGGGPGQNGVGSPTIEVSIGGTGNVPTGGNITNQPGGCGSPGISNYANGAHVPGFGGSSALGGGAAMTIVNPSVGNAAQPNTGGGGTGAQTYGTVGTFVGGAGGSGLIIIEEYS